MNDDITACVIIIGNEILSGRTQDLNLAFIGRRCDELGIQLNEARVIADVEATIVAALNECRAKFSYVFTTGGIGPTHDDITAAAVARAFGKDIIRNKQAIAALDRYYDSGNLGAARLKMADVPEDAVLIDNPISGAPGFQLENVFVLPGVPLIMQAMLDGIADRLIGGAAILTDNVATNLGESALAQALGELQAIYSDVSIGSYPYFRKGKLGVNLVMRSTVAERLASLKHEIIRMIEKAGGEIVE